MLNIVYVAGIFASPGSRRTVSKENGNMEWFLISGHNEVSS